MHEGFVLYEECSVAGSRPLEHQHWGPEGEAQSCLWLPDVLTAVDLVMAAATTSGARSNNTRSSGVRRLLTEASELQADECTDYQAAPLEVSVQAGDWVCTATCQFIDLCGPCGLICCDPLPLSMRPSVYYLTLRFLSSQDDLFQWHFTIRGPGGDFEGQCE
jgi:hypothetical protein